MLKRRVGPAVMRDLEPWHAEEFSELFQREDLIIFQWLAWEQFEDPRRPKASWSASPRGVERHPSALGLWLCSSSGAPSPHHHMRTGIAEIGVFWPPGTRRGIVTEAVKSLVDDAFDDLGMRRVEWRCSPPTCPAGTSEEVRVQPRGNASPGLPGPRDLPRSGGLGGPSRGVAGLS